MPKVSRTHFRFLVQELIATACSATASTTIVVTTTVAGTLPNVAQVSASQSDPNSSNNTNTTGLDILPAPVRATVVKISTRKVKRHKAMFA
jgi:hypothetical protein